ncbi:hypothetical protein [Baaleninema simplex]|uniref:hypothetical protein n=1 Tax=Baaleninema simplex TaxID=2862350 RepID=UPI001C5535F6|nr:hypothetical protein [Baaleninema simplex]
MYRNFKISIKVLIAVSLALLALCSNPACAQTSFDLTGTWRFVHGTSNGVLVVEQQGNSISGFLVNLRGRITEIQGTVMTLERGAGKRWGVMRVEFERESEPQVFAGYTSRPPGEGSGRLSGNAMSGNFTYNGTPAGMWYAEKLTSARMGRP